VSSPVYCLSTHAAYACRHSGACCTANWPIPAERQCQQQIDDAVADGRLVVPGGAGRKIEAPLILTGRAAPDPPAVLATDDGGACAFYRHPANDRLDDERRGSCEIHGTLGHGALPVSCQHFPRVCVLEPDATFVTLSHYCPTVAEAACRAATHPRIVEAPASLVAHVPLEGLDARKALPPLLRPDCLTDLAGYHAWVECLVDRFAVDQPVDDALWQAAAVTEIVRLWSPRRGSLEAAVRQADALVPKGGLSQSEGRVPPLIQVVLSARDDEASEQRLRLMQIVASSVPVGIDVPTVSDGHADDDRRLVAPRWPQYSQALRRYLAAKCVANWCAYQGRGLRTVVAWLATAMSVVRVEAARHCAEAGRPLDEALLIEALRSADLLLVHLVDPQQLADALGRVENEVVRRG
jgi:hypothetical protein